MIRRVVMTLGLRTTVGVAAFASPFVASACGATPDSEPENSALAKRAARLHGLVRRVADLYRAGTFRKYILVVTDGVNTTGVSPRRMAREINHRSEGAVRMYFVAFDVDAERLAFVRDVRGEVVGARNGDALRAGLDEIYRGKILSEVVDAGETHPAATETAARDSATRPTIPKRDTRP
jgi:hypothetical protein